MRKRAFDADKILTCHHVFGDLKQRLDRQSLAFALPRIPWSENDGGGKRQKLT